ncbi:SGNH/GDSL hydrolase family protein [Leifsonia sp. Root112D2]|jgi:lysophospholipase L1-like esterase|uniref:SGNH/GDSL hydrolase family protein n=1 Tax=Leifsonia sp. Root112D2 TaxID=1736426 RepID=UPI0009E7BE0D|nr:SGNH/GDSL hydrolase family protein [Leifsonia sp. Root112D2]
MHTQARRPFAGMVIGAAGFGVSAVIALLSYIGLGALRARSSARAGSGLTIPEHAVRYGDEHPGEALHFAVLGDSLAVGLGAENGSETVGAILSRRLASELARPVAVHNTAAVGAVSSDLRAQIVALSQIDADPEVALIVIGSNDVLHLVRVDRSARQIFRAVVDLRRMGARVVVATCPDLGTVRALFQPLRMLARGASRRLARAQTIVVLQAGGRPVPLGTTLGAVFSHRYRSMFSVDHVHPSPLGYARAAAVLFPSIRSAAEDDIRREKH